MSFSKSSLVYSKNDATSPNKSTKITALTVQTQYQAVVAELGLQALSGVDLNTLFKNAVRVVNGTLKVQYVSLLELLSDRQSLRMRAGINQNKILAEQTIIDIKNNLEISNVLNSNQPIFLENLITQTQPISRRLKEHNLSSRILVTLPNQDRPLGILEAYTNYPRTFNKVDLHFLQSVAHVIATAIQRQRSNDLLKAQSRVLELIATGATFDSILNSMCQLLEQLSPSAYCSILLLDSEKKQLRSGAAPSLPAAYANAFDQLVIGDYVDSCGTAAYRGESVFVEDISTDPLWFNRTFRTLSNALP